MTRWQRPVSPPHTWGRLYLESRHRVCTQALLSCRGHVPAALRTELRHVERLLHPPSPTKPPAK